MTPCLCGHAFHFRRPCEHEGCECNTGAPDYVAGEAAVLEAMAEPARSQHRANLQRQTRELAQVLGYRGPGTVTRTCAYCLGTFSSWRSHATTCSGACRQARSVARGYESEHEIPSPWARCDTFSEERARATGMGSLTAAEQYAHDLRVWQDSRREH